MAPHPPQAVPLPPLGKAIMAPHPSPSATPSPTGEGKDTHEFDGARRFSTDVANGFQPF